MDSQGNDYTSPERGGVVSRAFKRAQQRAGVYTGRPVHVLRHTAASWMVQAGVPLEFVGKVLGHKTPSTTMRYAHLRPEHLKGAMAALSVGGKPAKVSRRRSAS